MGIHKPARPPPLYIPLTRGRNRKGSAALNHVMREEGRREGKPRAARERRNIGAALFTRVPNYYYSCTRECAMWRVAD